MPVVPEPAQDTPVRPRKATQKRKRKVHSDPETSEEEDEAVAPAVSATRPSGLSLVYPFGQCLTVLSLYIVLSMLG